MALKTARVARYANGEIVSYHYDPDHPTQPFSTLNRGETREEIRARIAAVAEGEVEATIDHVADVAAVVASLHAETDEASLRHTALERKHVGLTALHDEMIAKVAAGTSAKLEDVHAAAHSVAEAIAVASMSEDVQRKVGALADREHARIAAEVHAARHQLVQELHAAIDVEMADKREEHAAIESTIDTLLTELPDETKTALLATRPAMREAHEARMLAKSNASPASAESADIDAKR